jgi:hypothetical protein
MVSWIVLVTMAASINIYWLPILYCIGLTVLEGVFCLGKKILDIGGNRLSFETARLDFPHGSIPYATILLSFPNLRHQSFRFVFDGSVPNHHACTDHVNNMAFAVGYPTIVRAIASSVSLTNPQTHIQAFSDGASTISSRLFCFLSYLHSCNLVSWFNSTPLSHPITSNVMSQGPSYGMFYV